MLLPFMVHLLYYSFQSNSLFNTDMLSLQVPEKRSATSIAQLVEHLLSEIDKYHGLYPSDYSTCGQ